MANAVVLDYPSAHSSVCPPFVHSDLLSLSLSLSPSLSFYRTTLENFCACHVQPVQLWQSPSAVPSSSYSLKATNPAQCTCCQSISSNAPRLTPLQPWPPSPGQQQWQRAVQAEMKNQIEQLIMARRGERMVWHGWGRKTA